MLRNPYPIRVDEKNKETYELMKEEKFSWGTYELRRLGRTFYPKYGWWKRQKYFYEVGYYENEVWNRSLLTHSLVQARVHYIFQVAQERKLELKESVR